MDKNVVYSGLVASGLLTLGFLSGITESAATGPSSASTVVAPAWQSLSEVTTCEAMRPDYCLGAYGFRIRTDGAFEAGYLPGVTAHTATQGRLEQADLDAVKNALADAAARAASWKTTDADKLIPGMSDKVTVVFTDGHELIVPVIESGLRELMKTLMKKYYPIPYASPSGSGS